ncbi:hypothetical protein GCM10011321_22220 [Youhaiella tibetensis]|nr:hypothetical protein [Youhaiella tibetensis]GGF30519.1 hypothetical protein GCM10011321_22220 [Youhaiella tibetensis]
MTNPLMEKLRSALNVLEGAREATAAARQHRRPSQATLAKLGLDESAR